MEQRVLRFFGASAQRRIGASPLATIVG
jgi:hypothetical protein